MTPTVMMRAALVAACIVSNTPPAVAQAADGVRFFEAAEYGRAKAVFEPALRSNPNDATASFYLGRIAMVEGRDGDAASFFERAVKLDATRSDYFLWLGRAYGRQAQHANVLRQAGLAKKTKNAWDRAVQLDPNNLDARENLIDYYLQAPGILGGSRAKAYAEAEEIRKRNALRGLLVLGRLYEGDKRYAEAERAYVYASKEPSERPVGQYRLGQLYVTMGAYERAFDVFESMLKANPLDRLALFLIGRTGAMSGLRLDRAEEALRAYIRSIPEVGEPTLANAHWRLGQIYERRSDTAQARTEYLAALRLDPKHKDAAAALRRFGNGT